MTFRPTFSLLAALCPAILASAAFAEDAAAPTTAPAKTCILDRAFVSFDTGEHRATPPLTPAMIPGGIDEMHARSLNSTGAVPTPIIAQEGPLRAVDAYRQYLLYQTAGSPAELGGFSAEDWQDYGQQFEQSVLGPDGFDPVQRIRVRQFYVSGPTRFINEQGRSLFEGYNAFISDRATLRTGAFLFTLEPELRLHNTTRTGYDPSWDARFGSPTLGGLEDRNGVTLMEATAQVEAIGMHLTIGRQAYVTGPAYHQQLFFSANAAPMWGAKLTTAEPMALPGQFAKLGYFSPEFFIGRRNHDTVVPDQWTCNVRLNWQVNDYIKLGWTLLDSTFGGQGHSSNLSTIPSLFDSNRDSAITDHKCGVDWSLISPWKSLPFEVYGELGWETRLHTKDLLWGWGGIRSGSNSFGWRQLGMTHGIHLPSLDKDGIFSATMEYSKTDPHWYVNNFQTGTPNNNTYLYDGQNIGAPMGGDADSYFVELRAKLGHGIEAFASTNFEQHGKSAAPVTETLWESKLGGDVNLGRAMGVMHGWYGEASIAWDRWRDFQGVKGSNEDGVAIGIGLRRGF